MEHPFKKYVAFLGKKEKATLFQKIFPSLKSYQARSVKYGQIVGFKCTFGETYLKNLSKALRLPKDVLQQLLLKIRSINYVLPMLSEIAQVFENNESVEITALEHAVKILKQKKKGKVSVRTLMHFCRNYSQL